MGRLDGDFLYAPWTDEEVRKLNFLQEHRIMHGYTCTGGGGKCSSPEGHVYLVATSEGFRCPKCNALQPFCIALDLEIVDGIENNPKELASLKKR